MINCKLFIAKSNFNIASLLPLSAKNILIKLNRKSVLWSFARSDTYDAQPWRV